jgi:Gpi18-like mannosyltransferase
MILVPGYLEKDDIKAGIFYAISFSLKSFSLVFFPLFILKSKRKVKFLLAGLLLPF